MVGRAPREGASVAGLGGACADTGQDQLKLRWVRGEVARQIGGLTLGLASGNRMRKE